MDNTGLRTARTPRQSVTGQGLVVGGIALVSLIAVDQGIKPEYVAGFAPIAQGILTLFGKFLRNVGDEMGWARFFA